MKQYVLDFPAPVAAPVEAPADDEPVAPQARTSWRSIALLLVVVGSLALALLYVAPTGWPASNPDIATIPTVDSALASAPQTEALRQPQPPAEVVAEPVELPPSSITRVHGRYLIELHSAAVGPALALLSKATGATVRGEDVLAGNPARITRTVQTDSPLEAWQAVFGGVVNFAATCTRAACAVRFVPTADAVTTSILARQPAADATEDEPATPAPGVATSIAAGKAPAVTAPAEDPSASEN
jgi:hypothetical protein